MEADSNAYIIDYDAIAQSVWAGAPSSFAAVPETVDYSQQFNDVIDGCYLCAGSVLLLAGIVLGVAISFLFKGVLR